MAFCPVRGDAQAILLGSGGQALAESGHSVIRMASGKGTGRCLQVGVWFLPFQHVRYLASLVRISAFVAQRT